jgi:hypothetical protein
VALIYQANEQRSPYRLRLRFDQALGAGAFVTSWYSLASLDSAGTDPTVLAALVVPNATDKVELALDVELAPGGAYELTVSAGVPAASGPPLAADATDRLVAPIPRPRVTTEKSQADVQSLIYGEDLQHMAGDYVEGADGDLGGLLGVENAVDALRRSAEGNGLPWDDDWGAHLRELVDATSPTVGTARGSLVRAMLADDRVLTADAEATASDDGTVDVQGVVKLVGGENQDIPAQISR